MMACGVCGIILYLCFSSAKCEGDVSKPVPPSSVFQLCSVMLSPRPLSSTDGKVYLHICFLVDKFRLCG